MEETLEQLLAEIGFDKNQYGRDAFLQKFPAMEEAMPLWEDISGRLITAGSAGVFKDGRLVMLLQFEREYVVAFWNPKNPESKEEANWRVSREAMCGLFGLYQLLGDVEKDGEAYMANLTPLNDEQTSPLNATP